MIYRFVVSSGKLEDLRSAADLADAHALGITALARLERTDLYFIEGADTESGLTGGGLSEEELQRIASELLSDPITQTAEWGRLILPTQPARQRTAMIEVALHPGVTDPVAEQLVRAAHELGIWGVTQAATGQRYLINGPGLDDAGLHRLARRLLANPVIQRYALGEIEPAFPQPAQASGRVERLPVRDLVPPELLALSAQRRAALDLAEMQAIQAYYQAERRDPTDVEFETIAQTWSEHCVHKTFRALITVRQEKGGEGEEIDNLLRTYLRSATDKIAAPWVRSAFVDNAGIIDFDEQYEISFKVETHNHPSAIEPFGGANTGVGGVIRDVLGVSAKPIAATDVLCFGPQDLAMEDLPEGVLHPRRIRSGVVAGVQDYGNKIGIPTVSGAILYDPGYTANPLVFCGCVGIAPKGSHPNDPQPGDRVIVLGGRTGRDGLRGATFSSMTMDGQTGEVAGASVQIGDPITEKGLIEVVTRAWDARLYHAITDCGAGGLSSAVGEMSRQTGADIDLKNVRLKYPGLAPWEIWLSEAQERMVLAAPPEALAQLQALCVLFDTDFTDIGAFNQTGRLVVRYEGQAVLELDNNFLHDGLPQRRLNAVLPQRAPASESGPAAGDGGLGPESLNSYLLRLLAHPNIASKADVIRIYDHEVQGGTVVKPLTGAQNDGPSDACVIKPHGTRSMRGIVLSNGINPEFGKLDTYAMAFSVVDEAIRNAVAAGADPKRVALLDNFCWGDPKRPETLGSLVEAVRGCHDAALYYGAPFISGKDSLNNEYLGTDGERHAIPPTLLISAIGIIEDIRQAVTMDLKAPGSIVYRIGKHRPVLGGSHLNLILEPPVDNQAVPGRPAGAPALYRALHAAMQQGLVRACHDLSEGGLALAAAEMCIGGRLGLSLTLSSNNALVVLFGETNGCLLVEVAPEACEMFESYFLNAPVIDPTTVLYRCGVVTREPRLEIRTPQSRVLISLPIYELVEAWQKNLS